jgi:hypothetical protein
MNQIFHTPDDEGRFGPCDIKKICMASKHGDACALKCHLDHQQIAVKGEAKTVVYVDNHGAHTWVQHQFEPVEQDHVAHLKANVAPDCTDCEFETWTPVEWAKENARLAKEGLTIVDRRRVGSVTK